MSHTGVQWGSLLYVFLCSGTKTDIWGAVCGTNSDWRPIATWQQWKTLGSTIRWVSSTLSKQSLFGFSCVTPSITLYSHVFFHSIADETPEGWTGRQATDKEMQAAIVLQAGWKGYLVREILTAARPGIFQQNHKRWDCEFGNICQLSLQFDSYPLSCGQLCLTSVLWVFMFMREGELQGPGAHTYQWSCQSF